MIPILGRINELSRKQRSSVGLTKAEKASSRSLENNIYRLFEVRY